MTDTKPTQEEILKNVKILATLAQESKELSNKIDKLTGKTEYLQVSIDSQGRNLDTIIIFSNTILPSVRTEVDRMTSHSEELHKLFKERLDGIKEDINSLRDRDIKSLATQTSVSDVNFKVERLKDLPTMEQITQKLVEENSPLATKTQLIKVREDIAWLKGVTTVQLFAVVIGLITIVFMLFNISSTVSKIPQSQTPLQSVPENNQRN